MSTSSQRPRRKRSREPEETRRLLAFICLATLTVIAVVALCVPGGLAVFKKLFSILFLALEYFFRQR